VASAAIIILLAAILSWIAVRRCPLARAIGRQIDQIAASSAR
jgi:hypothetical protein